MKIKMGLSYLLAVFLGLVQVAALAEDSKAIPLLIEGSWIQGAMIKGKTTSHANVLVLDKTLKADENGHFVFGLGRDIKGPVNITLNIGVQQSTFTFDVKQREYDVQRIEGVEKKYVSPPATVLERIRQDNKRIRKARSITSTLKEYNDKFVVPAEGPITGVYGSQRVFNGVPKRPHYGLDIGSPVGTPVVAPVGGVVTLAENDMYYSGGTLIIDHGHGISSTFIHLSEILVKDGDTVKQGQTIAEIGATGRVTGPHLDWRVNWYEQRLDPALLLKKDAAP
ncbi:Membrane proteins related to metalloendopeptidases [Alteromonadaceae bacterium Bs31]|nr:Membrane proteins related to metalloendopeptidases [Alteromonadaceae bacterium Bs31]